MRRLVEAVGLVRPRMLGYGVVVVVWVVELRLLSWDFQQRKVAMEWWLLSGCWSFRCELGYPTMKGGTGRGRISSFLGTTTGLLMMSFFRSKRIETGFLVFVAGMM